jgi:pyruvate dehydrogenase E2 component (dihydrolipoyllysine-residue acetyltransferase)
VENDKATVEIPSPMSGRVEKIHVAPNQTVKVGQVLVTFGDAGAAETRTTVQDGRARQAAPAQGEPGGAQPAAAGAAAEARAILNVDAPVARAGPVPATPSTRRLARELGVDLATVRATGPGGRVTDDDVRAAGSGGPRAAAAAGAPVADAAPSRPAEPREAPVAKPLVTNVTEPPLPNFEQWGPVERQALSHLRRTIAERMTLSATVIPHVTHFDRADITELDALIQRNLEELKTRGVTLTLTALILKAAALSLLEHPTFNASLDAGAGQLVVKRYVHVGVAVATERGLIVPVMRDVDRKPLLDVARELSALALRVREGKATLDDLRGGTFTVTNIGALGGTGAIPIINYPEVAILGVSRARLEPVVRDGQMVPRLMLPVSLTFDHRVADGADGARFASAIVRRLERPELLLGF